MSCLHPIRTCFFSHVYTPRCNRRSLYSILSVRPTGKLSLRTAEKFTCLFFVWRQVVQPWSSSTHQSQSATGASYSHCLFNRHCYTTTLLPSSIFGHDRSASKTSLHILPIVCQKCCRTREWPLHLTTTRRCHAFRDSGGASTEYPEVPSGCGTCQDCQLL